MSVDGDVYVFYRYILVCVNPKIITTVLVIFVEVDLDHVVRLHGWRLPRHEDYQRGIFEIFSQDLIAAEDIQTGSFIFPREWCLCERKAEYVLRIPLPEELFQKADICLTVFRNNINSFA